MLAPRLERKSRRPMGDVMYGSAVKAAVEVGDGRGAVNGVGSIAPRPVGTAIGRICTAKLPDTALHSGLIAPRLGGTTISRMTRKKQDQSRSGRPLAPLAG